MVDEITTAISRLPWLFVIARNSSFTYKGKAVDVKQVARELGVRYVLEGSVRKAADRVRITGQLIDTTTGAHIWADRFDGALDDIFALQDEVASHVVGAIEPKLRQSEIERATRKPIENLDAYDLYLRALALAHQYTAPAIREGISLLQRALAIDPSYTPASALIGWGRLAQRVQGWGTVSNAEITEAVGLAKRAIEAANEDPDTLWMAAFTISTFAGEHVAAMIAIDRALAINPNSAGAWMARGWVACYQSQPVSAIRAFEHAMRLSPRDPRGYHITAGRALAHLVAGEYSEATQWAVALRPGHSHEGSSLRAHGPHCGSAGSARSRDGAATRADDCRVQVLCHHKFSTGTPGCVHRRSSQGRNAGGVSNRLTGDPNRSQLDVRRSPQLFPRTPSVNRTYLSKLEKGAS